MTARRSLGTVAVLVAGLVVAACGGGGGEDVPLTVPDVQTTDPASAQQAEEDANALRFVLLNPGHEPRQDLRLGLTAGDTGRTELTMAVTQDLEVGGQSLLSMFAPPTQVIVATEVQSVDEGGVATIGSTVEEAHVLDVGLYPDDVAAIDERLQQLVGATSTERLSPTGPVEDSATIEIPAGVDPAVARLMEQLNGQAANLSMHLPTEPVGVGARWSEKRGVTFAGIDVDLSTTYEVLGIDGSVLTLGIRQEQWADPQDADLPGLTEGGTAAVERYEIVTRGEAVVDLSSGLAEEARARGSGTIVFRLTTGAESGRLSQVVELGMTAVRLA